MITFFLKWKQASFLGTKEGEVGIRKGENNALNADFSKAGESPGAQCSIKVGKPHLKRGHGVTCTCGKLCAYAQRAKVPLSSILKK